MSDIKRNIRNQTEPEDTADDNYDTRIRNHRKHTGYAILIVILVLAVTALIVVMVTRKSSFSGYTSLGHITLSSDSQSVIRSFGDGFVKITRDGASAYDNACNALWDVTFEISEPAVDMCGNYFIAYDKGGLNMYIVGADGFNKSIRTNLPILKGAVSANGVAAVILEDSTADYIRMFDKEGNTVSDIKVVLSQTGTPINIDISEDGDYMMVSYVTIEGTQLASSVVFYNFGSAGQDVNQKLIGGFASDALVPAVYFINDAVAASISENQLRLYSVGRNVAEIKTIDFEDRINRIFYSDKYIGIVTMPEDGDYVIRVYDAKGQQEMKYETDFLYDHYGFTDSYIYMYADSDVKMLNMAADTVFEYTFDDAVVAFDIQSGDKYYVHASPSLIERIKLK